MSRKTTYVEALERWKTQRQAGHHKVFTRVMEEMRNAASSMELTPTANGWRLCIVVDGVVFEEEQETVLKVACEVHYDAFPLIRRHIQKEKNQ